MKFPALLLALTLISQPAAALNSDLDQPIQIQADSSLLNQGQGIDRYSGRVELSQGSLLLMADELLIHKNQKGSVTKIVANGKPVHLQQLNEQQQKITATASTITFIAGDGIIELTKDAQLVHPGNAVVNAYQITYDSRTSQVRSHGGKNPDPGKRPTIILQPQGSQLNVAPENEQTSDNKDSELNAGS